MMTAGVHGFRYALGKDVNRSPPIGGPGTGGPLSGQTYDAYSVLVKFTYRGDADLDGDIDLDDLGLLANSFTGKSSGVLHCSQVKNRRAVSNGRYF
jgi:hypothetical protein